LKTLKENYPCVPILGLTATATQEIQKDIIKLLGIEENLVCFQNSFNRPNLFYQFKLKDKLYGKTVDDDIAHLLKTKLKDQSGIIYCISRKDCEAL
jgi:superfamily II DNA helicase RecQ